MQQEAASISSRQSGDHALSVRIGLHTGEPLLDDGQTLVTDGPTGAVFLDMDAASWRATACRLAGRNLTPEEWATYLPDEPERPTCP